MCGVAGVLNFNGRSPAPEVLQRMTDAIKHRGPDGEGHFIKGPVGLGHRRLAILDLSPAGKQPMVTDDGRFVLSYNGEIYNFQQLRKELQELGYQFRSRTDSEVLLNAYVEWGEKCLTKFNGMFAFALWDNVEQSLFLARDRYGIKPLYYHVTGEHLIFGSEIKAIVAHPDYEVDVDRPALYEYFTFQNFFGADTLFKDVKMFPAGSFWRWSASGDSSPITTYWDFNFAEDPTPMDAREYEEELDRLLGEAVKRQLVSDVDIGSYLSGGMDSGALTALASAQLPLMRTFTVGFDMNSASGMELSFDERDKAEYMSYLFKTEQYEAVLKAGDMERAIPSMVWHLEEPRVGQSYPNYYAAKLASKFVKVVLSGSGGDEIFAGYPWRYYRAVVNDSFENYIDKYYSFWHRLIPNSKIQEVFQPIWPDVNHVWTKDTFRNVFLKHSEFLTTPEDYINHSLYFEAKTFLHGLLVVEDKLSMAHGLETRVPFLDNDVVDFAMRIPSRMKLGNLKHVVRLNENEPGPKSNKYFEKTKDGKLIFRKVMQKHIPKEVTNRVKQGFSAPDSSWFRGESIDFVKATVFDSNARMYSYLDQKTVQNLVSEHLDAKQNRRLLIWSLLNFEQWLKTFMP